MSNEKPADIKSYLDSVFSAMNENEKKIAGLMETIHDYRLANQNRINEIVSTLVNEISARDIRIKQLLPADEVPSDYSALKPEDLKTPPAMISN